MRPRRFQVADLSGAIISVEGEEANHALRVLRLKTGSAVVLFDGQGHEVTGIIRATGRSRFDVEVLERCEATATRGATLTIATAVPKGDRADWLVEKCAEFGTLALALLRCERSEVVPGEGKIDRWRRKAIQVAKQARLATVMAVERPRGVAEILREVQPGTRVWCADPDSANPTFAESLRATAAARTSADGDLAFVGPEGGFAEGEINAIRHAGGQRVRLCRPILRVETAAVAVACLWSACLEDLKT